MQCIINFNTMDLFTIFFFANFMFTTKTESSSCSYTPFSQMTLFGSSAILRHMPYYFFCTLALHNTHTSSDLNTKKLLYVLLKEWSSVAYIKYQCLPFFALHRCIIIISLRICSLHFYFHLLCGKL